MSNGQIEPWGFPPSSTPGATINTFQDILSLAQDPVFLLQQGFITPEAMLQYIQSVITQPVLQSTDYDTEALRAFTPSADTTLQGAYDLIDNGMTVNQVRAKMLEDMAKANGGSLTTTEVSVIDAKMKDVEEYARRKSNFDQLQEKQATGEWQLDPVTGQVKAQREDARQILSAAGLEGLGSLPELWQPIPDQALMSQALAKYGQADEARNSWIELGKKAAKDSQLMAKAVYDQFLTGQPKATTPVRQPKGAAGAKRTGIQGVGTPRETQPTRGFGGRGASGEFGVSGPAPKVKESSFPAGRTGGAGSARFGGQATPTPTGNTNADIIARMTPQQRDQWAKMAASYAGRAAQESSSTQKRAAANRQTAESKFLEAQRDETAAMQAAVVPALQWLMNAPMAASYVAQPAPESMAGKRTPRTLSDQEIETMANMIAGGMA